MKIIKRPSPNYGKRNDKIKYLIFHATALDTIEQAFEALIFSKEPHRVSSHYLIDRDGSIYQLVDDEKKAFHAGISDWAFTNNGKAIKSMNDCSIGIEFQCPLKNGKFSGFTKAQVKSGIELSRFLMNKHQIKRQNVLAHSDIAPHRKQDPDVLFPWRTFALAGVGLWTKGKEPKKNTLKRPLAELLMIIGYPLVFGIDENIKAFKRHFMPRAQINERPSLTVIKRAAELVEELEKL